MQVSEVARRGCSVRRADEESIDGALETLKRPTSSPLNLTNQDHRSKAGNIRWNVYHHYEVIQTRECVRHHSLPSPPAARHRPR